MDHSRPKLELCCADIQSVALAAEFDFDGIEICIDLASGGLSPSLGFLELSRKIFSKEISVLLRPRPGDFIYSKREKDIILADLSHFLDFGANTFVVGALTPTKEIDVLFMEKIIQRSAGASLCFHRAIDFCADIMTSLIALKELQFDRILSSGGKSNAMEGIQTLKEMVNISENKIEIMAGGGIRGGNVGQIIKNTHVSRLHFSALLKSTFDTAFFGNTEIADEEEIQKILNIVRFKHDSI